MTHDSMESEILDYIQLQRKREEYTSILQMRYDLLKSELEALKKPPTADEVCKALSEFIDREVTYDDAKKDFVDGYRNSVEHFLFDSYHLKNIPPHLITMIGRFYEGLK